MANLYVDHVSGSDTTGDGTIALPYKTVEKAVVGLVGGDEVRCKQTDQIDLNGTLTFTNNSTSVATTQDLTSQISANDCIRHPADLEAWWPVASLTSSAITLKYPYWGTAGSGKTAKRMRPVVITTNPEIFDHRGLGEPGNLLKVIGGWDFNTDTQVGLTALANLSTGSAPQCFTYDDWTTEYVEIGYIELSYFYCFTGYSYAINLPWHSYAHHIYWSGGQICLFWGGRLEQSYCGGTRESYGVNALGVNGQDPVPWSDVPHGITGWLDFSMKDIWVYSNGNTGFSPYLATGVIDNVNFFNSKNYAMDLTYVGNLYIQNCMFDTNRTATDGLIWLDFMCQKVHFYNCTIKNAIGYGVEFDSYDDSNMAIFVNCTFENNTGGDFKNYNVNESNQSQLVPIFTVSNPNGESVRYYKDMATIHHTATGSRSGKCLKFTPRDASFSTTNKQNLMDRVGTHKIQSSNQVTLGIYLKKSSDFNGTVYFLAIRDGCWIRMPEEVTSLTESYAQKTYIIETADLIYDEVIEFFVLVEPGTAGSVYADDFSGET